MRDSLGIYPEVIRPRVRIAGFAGIRRLRFQTDRRALRNDFPVLHLMKIFGGREFSADEIPGRQNPDRFNRQKQARLPRLKVGRLVWSIDQNLNRMNVEE